MFYFFFKGFIYFEREKAQAGAGAGQRERQASRWAGGPMRGSIPGRFDHDMSRRQPLNKLSHPGAPGTYF